MIHFKPKDRFVITRRGPVYTGPSPVEVNHAKELVGQTVDIDGTQYTVKGVEAFHDKIHIGDPIGLLV